MGFYLNPEGCTATNKTDAIVAMGAELVAKPKSFDDIPEDKYLIAVGDRGVFEFAGVAIDEREFEAMCAVTNCPMMFYLMDKEIVDAELKRKPDCF